MHQKRKNELEVTRQCCPHDFGAHEKHQARRRRVNHQTLGVPGNPKNKLERERRPAKRSCKLRAVEQIVLHITLDSPIWFGKIANKF